MATEDSSGVPIVGPGSPYITPAMLISASTGIAWSMYPDRGSTPAQQYAAQLNVCMRATAQVDTFCNQPLRATIDTETFIGPGDFRCQVQPNGTARLLTSRSPVTSIVSARYSSATAFPAQWTTIAADQLRPEQRLLGVYGTTAPSSADTGGQAIILAPGYLNWWAGRKGTLIEVTYGDGWPHAALTTASAEGATSLVVDDITGWEGAAGIIYDGGNQETAVVTAVTPAVADAVSGPGTLTLSRALTYAHESGILVSAMTANVQQASIYFAVAQALTRGATATTVQSTSGSSSGSGAKGSTDYVKLAQDMLTNYRLTV